MVLDRQTAVAPPLSPRRSGPTTMVKRFDRPERMFVFDSGRLEVVTVAGRTIAKGSFAPGWRWSRCALHDAAPPGDRGGPVGVVLSGSARMAMEDGSEIELKPGDLFHAPITPEHDAWVVGPRPCEILYLDGIETLICRLHGPD